MDKSIFGWKAVAKSYTIYDLVKDSVIPGIISLVLTFVSLLSSVPSLKLIVYATNVMITITPTIVSLLLAAYAILMAMYWSQIGEDIKKDKENGIPLLNALNASFAMAIKVMTIGFLFVLISNYIAMLQLSPILKIPVKCINYSVLFIVVYLMCFFIWIIKDIAINIYNIGKYSSMR